MDSFLSPALPPGPVEIEYGGRELGLRIHCVAEVIPGRTVDVSGSLKAEETAAKEGE